ncbi:hypothetical protein [Cytobacillus sp. SAFR-174]|uniref:hypothetical protein n=1 Tax=Cytobacillus sp. SAFR-174 TaxID=3436868 RepID=UPI003F7FB919
MEAEIIKIIFNGITEIFGNNLLDLIVYLAILALFLWLYKQFRIKLIEDEKYRREEETIILMRFLELEFELNNFYSSKSNFDKVKECLVNVYPYLTYDNSKKVEEFNLNMSDETILGFINDIRREKNGIKYNQFNEIANKNEKSIMKMLEYQYRTKFLPLLQPLLLSLFSILTILLFTIILIGYIENDSFEEKFYITLVLINLMSFLILIIVIIDLFSIKKIKKERRTWVWLAVVLLLSILYFTFFVANQILSIFLFIFYLVFCFKVFRTIINHE